MYIDQCVYLKEFGSVIAIMACIVQFVHSLLF